MPLSGSIQLRQVTSATAAASTEVPLDGQPVLVVMPDGKFRFYRGDGSTQLQTLYVGQKYLPTNEAILTLLTAYLETSAVDTDVTLAAGSNALVPSQLAIKTYVDNLVAGVDWKEQVRVATTANITLSGTQTIDGVSVVADDRVLVKDQTAGAENGIYLCKAGAWARAADGDSALDLQMAYVQVMRGGVHSGQKWRLLTNPITLGTTALVWQQDTGGSYTADESTLTLSGSQFSAKNDGITVAKLQAVILKAIGALTPAANKGLYFVDGTTAALFDLDAFTRGILNAGDAVSWLRNIKALYNNYAAYSANDTLIASDAGKLIAVTTAGSTITMTIPAASSVAAGTCYAFKKMDTGVGTVVTSPATDTLRLQGDTMVLMSDATNWLVVQKESRQVPGTDIAYSGTPTYTAGAAPSGATNHHQFYTQVGNLVTWQIMLTHATTGTTVTGISATLPAEFPTPAIPTGWTGASAFLYLCTPARFISSPTGSMTLNTNCHLKRNAADNGFEIVATVASGSYRSVILSGSYFTS